MVQSAGKAVLMVTLVVVALLKSEAVQAEPLAGIAFAQAPEMGMGVATGTDMAETVAAARAECVASGAGEADCMPMAWCQPAGWSIDLFVMHSEGPHWHEVICGLPDRNLAEQLAETYCAASERLGWSECLLVQVYDHAGLAQLD